MHTNIVSLAFDGLSSNYVWAGTAEGDVLVFNTHVSRDRNHVCKRMATHAAPGARGRCSHCNIRTHCVIAVCCALAHTPHRSVAHRITAVAPDGGAPSALVAVRGYALSLVAGDVTIINSTGTNSTRWLGEGGYCSAPHDVFASCSDLATLGPRYLLKGAPDGLVLSRSLSVSLAVLQCIVTYMCLRALLELTNPTTCVFALPPSQGHGMGLVSSASSGGRSSATADTLVAMAVEGSNTVFLYESLLPYTPTIYELGWIRTPM